MPLAKPETELVAGSPDAELRTTTTNAPKAPKALHVSKLLMVLNPHVESHIRT